MSRIPQALARVFAVLLVIVLAAGLRLRAVQMLPPDYDEDDYLRAGQQYANGIRAGDWGVFTRENYRTEHPPLSKIVYGLAELNVPPFADIPDRPVDAPPDATLAKVPLQAARLASAAFGVLETAGLAIVSPLAGLLLAVHTFTIKYTSQVMLEGVPSFTSLLVILFYLAWQKKRWKGWLALSAVALGLTAAAKYYYCIVGVVVVAHWLYSTYNPEKIRSARAWARWLGPVAAWGLLALVAFFAADPYLWPDPIHRLAQSISYHAGYAQSKAVSSAGLPLWQPLIYLSISVPWHPGVFLVSIDMLITLLAFSGIQRARQRHPLFLLWLALGLAFLLLWPTKWPQYILMITAPLSMVASDGFSVHIYEPAARWLKTLSRRTEAKPAVLTAQVSNHRLRQVLPWLLPGLLALALITVFPLIFQTAISMTDFQARAIRDGLNGGVWREVWLGISGQVQPVLVNLDGSGGGGTKIHYAGLSALITILFNAGDLYVFELIWTVLTVASQAALGVAVALLLQRRGVRFKGFWQAIFILPWAVPEFVAALAWSQIFDPKFGFLAMAAAPWSQQAPGVAQAIASWQNNAATALVVLLTAGLWFGFPFMLLSARAGLKLIPPEVYDAAAIDGASGWTLFRMVTWPLVFPLLAPAIILRSIFAFNQFYLFAVMNTPVVTLSALSYFIFDGGRYSISAAINIVTVIILIFLVLWFNRLTKANEGVTYA